MSGMSQWRVAGLDLSLTSTGVALPDGTAATFSSKLRGVERLEELTAQTLFALALLGVDLVVIEGYAFGRTNQAHQLGELGGCVRLALHHAGYRVAVFPPKSLKKFASGNGNADKARVTIEARDRLNYDGYQNDEADALWLRQAGLHFVSSDQATPLPKVHVAALDKFSPLNF